MSEDVGDRVKRLRAELEAERDHYLWLGRRGYFASMGLIIVTIGSSALAGILGLGFGVDTRIVAAIALIPGVAVSIANQSKLQGKVDWHYRKYDALKALLRRVNYDLPPEPTVAQVAEIAAAFSKVEAEMTADWEKSLTADIEESRSPG